jgi:hypothetical protein
MEKRFFIIAIICLCLAACQPRDAGMLPGRYIFEDHAEIDILVLEKNNVIMRALYNKRSGETTIERGGWQYPDSYGHISLNLTDQADPSKTDHASKGVEYWWGKIYIGMSEDGARQYKKID